VLEKEAKAAEHAALTLFANERREQRVGCGVTVSFCAIVVFVFTCSYYSK